MLDDDNTKNSITLVFLGYNEKSQPMFGIARKMPLPYEVKPETPLGNSSGNEENTERIEVPKG